MIAQMQRQIHWRTLPLIGLFISEWQYWRTEQTKPCYSLALVPDTSSHLLPYALDMWPLLALPHGTLDEAGIPYNAQTRAYPATYHPTTIAQYALAQWNRYLTTGDEKCKQAFMAQAYWLVTHEKPLIDDAGGWPIPFPVESYHTPETWLSAMTQGSVISVLVRAYLLTSEDAFLYVARRAVHTFRLDIRDGGVSTTVGNNGIFFEEVAAYPAAHILNGYIFALFGLYDYVALTKDSDITTLIQRSLVTMHTLIAEFDMGYWSRYDLLLRTPANLFYHSLHIKLLEALSKYSECEHCKLLGERWHDYKRNFRCILGYFIVSGFFRYRRGLRRMGIRATFLRILGVER